MGKKKAIEFSADERRALGLGYGKLDGTYREQKALRDILDHFHWIVKVADCKYDPKVALTHVCAASAVMVANLSIDEYQDKQKAQS